MYLSTYRGEDEIRTTFATEDEQPTVCCLNDECPGIEVVYGTTIDGDEVEEVIRIAWDAAYIAPSGFDAGYNARDACPDCGQPGTDIESLY